MKIYISSHDRDEAESLAAKLTAAGHEIVSTWHRPSRSPKPDLADWEAWWAKARNNFDLIKTADALVVIACPEGVACPGGKFVEAGYAFGSGVDVWHLGRCENGMMNVAYDGGHTSEELIEELAAIRKPAK